MYLYFKSASFIVIIKSIQVLSDVSNKTFEKYILSISYSLGIVSFNFMSIFIRDICEILYLCLVPLHSLSVSHMFSFILDSWILLSPLCTHSNVSV